MSGQPSKDLPATADGLFPIRTVSSLTGVNPVTLRAWERRYNLIRPQRTPKGHRLYTRQDVERIQRVVELLDQGISIGQVRPLLEREVEPAATGSESAPDVWQQYLERMSKAIERFDELALDATYNDALSLYPVDLVNSRLTTPLLRILGKRWKEEAAGVAEEHFFSVYLRNKLGTRIHHLNARNVGPRLLVACLPGEYHEVGMLFFALAAVNHGYRVLVLGANLPLDQVPGVLKQRSCDAVVLSGSARPARTLLNEQLPDLCRALSVPVFVGGAVTERHTEAIEAAGALSLGREIPPALRRIGSLLAQPVP